MKRFKRWLYRKISTRYMNNCSAYNSLEVRKSCRSKAQARAGFAKGDIPHAKGLIFFNPFKAIAFAQTHGFPLVVKPNVSGYSRGSYFPINNYWQLWQAIFWARLWWPTSVIETYLLGHNYRVVVIDNEIMSVIERFPPFVIGDGKSTIDQLIDAENQTRMDMQLHPVMYPIEKSKTVLKELRKQGLSLNSVPIQGQHVTLFFRVALAPGGIVKTIDKATLPEANKDLFLKVLKLFDANILGIDVIMKTGIDQPWQEQECILLEVNSRPYLKMHDFPRYGQKENLSEYYRKLDSLDVKEKDIF